MSYYVKKHVYICTCILCICITVQRISLVKNGFLSDNYIEMENKELQMLIQNCANVSNLYVHTFINKVINTKWYFFQLKICQKCIHEYTMKTKCKQIHVNDKYS